MILETINFNSIVNSQFNSKFFLSTFMIRTRVLSDGGENNLTFPTDDRIFLGEGLFETLKVESGKPCCAYLHWQRLSDSAQKLSIPFDLSFEHWLEHLLHKIKGDNLYHGGIKSDFKWWIST